MIKQREYKQGIPMLQKMVVYPTNGPRDLRKEFVVEPSGTKFKKGERDKVERHCMDEADKFYRDMKSQQNFKASYNWQIKPIVGMRIIKHQEIR